MRDRRSGRLGDPPVWLLAVGLAGCDRACLAQWTGGREGADSASRAPFPVGALSTVDCPDGLGRCENAIVSVSRLATIPLACKGPPSSCACPWRRVALCAHGCAADGVEVVIDEAAATVQLCAPADDVGGGIAPAPADPTLASPACEEGQRYQCAGGIVSECLRAVGIGRCARGCFREGASIDDDGVSREAAFAVLCSR